MAARRRPHDQDPNASTPAQQDEADIVAEVGAERDEDIGELVADEERIRALGAVDAESVRENRRLKDIVNKKRGNVKGVPFNAGDLLTKYETLIKFWPVNTIDISVKRLTGSPVQQMIVSRPRSGVELYEAIKAIHGQYEEAKYELKFFDNNSKEFRGNGQITMPDTRAAASPQQGQPMQHNPYNPYGTPPPGYPGYPPGYGMPPTGYPPSYAAQPGYPPQQQPPQQQAPQAPQQAPQQQPPTVQVMPSSFDPHQMMSMMDQMFQMFRQMQSAAQPPPQPPPPSPHLQYPPMPVPMPMQQMPPMPPPQASPAEQMAWMQQAFEMFRQFQSSQQPPAAAHVQYPPPQVQQPAPPPPSSQSSMAEAMTMMQQMFKLFQQMQPPPAPPGPGPYRGPFRPPYGGGPGGPPPYPEQYPGAPGAPGTPGPRPYGPPGYGHPGWGPPQPPPREKTAAEQFREAMGVVRTAVEAVQDINNMMPGVVPNAGAAPSQEGDGDDGSPIQVIDTGPAKLVINKEDGSLRKWETGWANMDKVFKWVGEQREAITRAAVERRAEERQHPPQQLPPGYVEVHPGYQPPPGYVAVPVDPQQQMPSAPQQHALPPPPDDVPPPINQPPQRSTWGMPTYPGQGEG